MLDAANYTKEKSNEVTDDTINNVFINAYLRVSLDSAVTETFDNNEFLKLFDDFNITASEQDIN